MKKLIILLIGLSLVSCQQSKKEEKIIKVNETVKKPDNFDWLLGKWERLHEEEGKQTFENWTKESENQYSGNGFTMKQGDTIKQELMTLTNSNGTWNLAVKTLDETDSVVFKMIHHSKNEFTCENTAIDFPNKIRYWKNGKNLHASVSNEEMEIPFEFKKLSN